MTFPLVLALALVSTAAPTPPATPPAGRPFTPEVLLSLPRVSEPAVSPDGRLVAFTVARPAEDRARLESSLWLVPTSGGAPRRLTAAPGERVGSPRFSPDGRRLAFASTRGGGSQAFVIAVDGGEATPAPKLASDVNEVLGFTPDGRALLVTSDVDPACGADQACHARREAEARGRPKVTDRLLYRHWNTWRDRLRSHVVRLPLDGSAPVDLTPGDRDVPPFQRGDASDVVLSADGAALLFPAVVDPLEAISTNADVFSVSLAGGEPRRLTDGAGWDGTPRPSPSGKLLAWRSQARAGYESDRFRLLVAPPGGKPRELAPALDASVLEVGWSAEERLLFTADEEGTTNLYEVEAKGGPVRRLATGANLHALSFSRDGSVVAGLVDGLARPPEVAVWSGGKLRVLTRFGEEALAGVALGAVRPLTARSRDGTTVHGLQVTPPGHRTGEKRPAVVLVHGGPQGAWKDAWSFRWNPLVYAARGYTVVLPNPRGSTGRGMAYQDAVRANWGGSPFEDVMAVVDAAVAAGEADGERMCAAGASYGGYMVHWLNGHTDRFRCLVAHAGLFNLEAAYYDTEETWFPEWELGRPWEDRTAYERWSPHLAVKRWRTPTLVTHGELDYRVTVTQGLAAYTALQRLGVPSRLVVFPDEGHFVLKPNNAQVFHELVLGWLEEHLGRPAAVGPRPENP